MQPRKWTAAVRHATFGSAGVFSLKFSDRDGSSERRTGTIPASGVEEGFFGLVKLSSLSPIPQVSLKNEFFDDEAAG